MKKMTLAEIQAECLTDNDLVLSLVPPQTVTAVKQAGYTAWFKDKKTIAKAQAEGNLPVSTHSAVLAAKSLSQQLTNLSTIIYNDICNESPEALTRDELMEVMANVLTASGEFEGALTVGRQYLTMAAEMQFFMGMGAMGDPTLVDEEDEEDGEDAKETLH